MQIQIPDSPLTPIPSHDTTVTTSSHSAPYITQDASPRPRRRGQTDIRFSRRLHLQLGGLNDILISSSIPLLLLFYLLFNSEPWVYSGVLPCHTSLKQR